VVTRVVEHPPRSAAGDRRARPVIREGSLRSSSLMRSSSERSARGRRDTRRWRLLGFSLDSAFVRSRCARLRQRPELRAHEGPCPCGSRGFSMSSTSCGMVCGGWSNANGGVSPSETLGPLRFDSSSWVGKPSGSFCGRPRSHLPRQEGYQKTLGSPSLFQGSAVAAPPTQTRGRRRGWIAYSAERPTRQLAQRRRATW